MSPSAADNSQPPAAGKRVRYRFTLARVEAELPCAFCTAPTNVAVIRAHANPYKRGMIRYGVCEACGPKHGFPAVIRMFNEAHEATLRREAMQL